MISTEVSSLATHNTEHRKCYKFKLYSKWRGPRRIASVESDYVFVGENLLTMELKEATRFDSIRLRK
jgi:hypothetical protein